MIKSSNPLQTAWRCKYAEYKTSKNGRSCGCQAGKQRGACDDRICAVCRNFVPVNWRDYVFFEYREDECIDAIVKQIKRERALA